MIIGCDRLWFLPLIGRTNQICLECRYCERREEITKNEEYYEADGSKKEIRQEIQGKQG